MKSKRTWVTAIVIATTMFSSVTVEAGFFQNLFGGFLDNLRNRKQPNIAEYVINQNQRKDEFNTLLAALTAVSEEPELPDLVGVLSNDGPFTVFAPTDEAFGDLGLDATNIGTALPLGDLTDILLYHVTAGKKNAFNLLFERDIEMLNGDTAEFNFSLFPFGFFINDAKVVDANNSASNGIVHVIDSVLLPPQESMPATSSPEPQFAAIPEPSSLVLACGLLLWPAFARRRSNI